MQETTLWEGSPCPLCESQGLNSKLKFYRLNFREAALLCRRKKCPFPLSTNYPDIFVRIGLDGNIIPGSQSERGCQHEEEADSDDSPYISDASEESVTFPDMVPEVNTQPIFSLEKTKEEGALEVDAFDISSIDFETDDSLDTFKLRNEITSLEEEITKNVENMKSGLPHVNCKDSSVLNKDTEKCINSDSVAAKTFANVGDSVCTDTHAEFVISDSNYAKKNENGVESCNYRKSGDIILHEHDSATSIPGSLELIKISEELGKCVKQSDTNTPISNKCILSHTHTDVQNNSNKNVRGEGCTVVGGLEDVDIMNDNCSDNDVEKQLHMFTVTKSSIPVIPQDIKNAMGNDLSRTCELHEEPVTNESVNFIINDNTYESEMCVSKEVVILFDDNKNSEGDNNVIKQPNTVPEADAANSEHEPSVLLSPQTTKHTVGNSVSRKCKLHANLASNKAETMYDYKEMDIIFDNHSNDCSDNNEGKQFDTMFMADTSSSEPGPSVLVISEGMKSTVENGLPRQHELCMELVSNESVSIDKDNDCGKENGEEMIIISEDCNSSSKNFTEKELTAITKVNTSNPRPEKSVLLTPRSMENIVENDLPKQCELLAELVLPVVNVNDCGNKCDDKELEIIFKNNEDSEVCEIVAIESDKASTSPLNDSRNYEVVNLQLRFCDTGNQTPSGGNAGRKTKNVCHRVENTVEKNGKRSSQAYSDSEIVTPSVKLRVLEESGLFSYTTNSESSSVSEVERTKEYKNTFAGKASHSKNCVCFLCSESNTKGITSHLDRALADLFPEECSTAKHFAESELPTEKEVMRDFVQYMTGSSKQNNTKRSPNKKNRLFHL